MEHARAGLQRQWMRFGNGVVFRQVRYLRHAEFALAHLATYIIYFSLYLNQKSVFLFMFHSLFYTYNSTNIIIAKVCMFVVSIRRDRAVVKTAKNWNSGRLWSG